MNIDFVNSDPVNAVNSLGLKPINGKLESTPLDIEYNGKKVHFNSKLDAYRWSYQNNDINKLYAERDRLKKIYNGDPEGYSFRDFVRESEDNGFFNTWKKLGKQQAGAGRELYEIENKIRKIEKEQGSRREALRKNGYYITDKEYRNIADTYGFDVSSDFSIDDIRNAT